MVGKLVVLGAFAGAVMGAVLSGCGGDAPAAKTPADQAATSGSTSASAAGAGAGALTSFARSPDSLKVDKVGGADGQLAPDGNMDAAFTADVEGPLAALLVVSVDAKGTPTTDFMAGTLVGDQKEPKELASADTDGKDTAGVGVFEGGKVLNAKDGSVSIPAGKHSLTLYFANTGVLQSGASIRLYGVRADQTVIAGPTAAF